MSFAGTKTSGNCGCCCALARDDLALDGTCGHGSLAAIWIQSTSPPPSGGTSVLPDGAWIVYNLTPPTPAVKVISWATPGFESTPSDHFATARLLIGWQDEDNYFFAQLVGQSATESHLEIGKRIAGVETILATGDNFGRDVSGGWRLQACLQQFGEQWSLSMTAQRYDDFDPGHPLHTLSANVDTPPDSLAGLMAKDGAVEWVNGDDCGGTAFQLDKIDANCPCTVQSSSEVDVCCDMARLSATGPFGYAGQPPVDQRKLFMSLSWSGTNLDCCDPVEIRGWVIGGVVWDLYSEPIGPSADAAAPAPPCINLCVSSLDFSTLLDDQIHANCLSGPDSGLSFHSLGPFVNTYSGPCTIWTCAGYEIFSCNPFHARLRFGAVIGCLGASGFLDCDSDDAFDAILNVEITE